MAHDDHAHGSTTLADRPRLVIAHGEKGGVGKTTFARVLSDYYHARKLRFCAYDGEGPNGPLRRFYEDATLGIDFTDAASVAPVLDQLMEASGTRIALVDLGARAGADLKAWLHRGGALEEAAAGRIGVTIAYVLGGGVDSVGHLKECYAALGNAANYLIVRNLGVAAKFPVYESSRTRQDLLGAGALEMALPQLDAAVYQSVDRASLSFSEFAENGGFSFTERRYCRTWLRECFAALDLVAPVLR